MAKSLSPACALVVETNKANAKTPFARVKLSFGGSEVKLGELKHHVFIYRPYDLVKKKYRAFCAGSIISQTRVLTSAHCFLTNMKRHKEKLKEVRVVGGILNTLAREGSSSTQQWREIRHVYSQSYYRFPAYNLAVLDLTVAWAFDQFVNKIPYVKLNQDFDGICTATTAMATSSWSTNKQLFKQQLRVIPRTECEVTLLRWCRLYYCTAPKPTVLGNYEAEGGGLICHHTHDPEETDTSQGILIGVTAIINIHLPTLHNRIGLFHKWVTDGATAVGSNLLLIRAFVLWLVVQ